jgi:hypothetical protein
MAVSSRDLVGRGIYARDGVRMGTIRQLVHGREYVVVPRSTSALVVPLRAIEWSDDRPVIPHTSSQLDAAPTIDTKHPLSAQDRSRLERFHAPHAA